MPLDTNVNSDKALLGNATYQHTGFGHQHLSVSPRQYQIALALMGWRLTQRLGSSNQFEIEGWMTRQIFFG